MAETDDRAPADDPVDLRSKARPMPATPPVIEVRPAEAPDPASAPQREIEVIDSSLVGEGGLPPAARRSVRSVGPVPQPRRPT